MGAAAELIADLAQRDIRLSRGDGDALSCFDAADVPTEIVFQLTNARGGHARNIATYGHIGKSSWEGRSSPVHAEVLKEVIPASMSNDARPCRPIEPMCVSDTNSTRTSHPPERGGESSIGERRCAAEAQRRRSPSRDQALELSGQHA